MPLILEPERLPPKVLDETVAGLETDLTDVLEMVRKPRGAVLDPASLVVAEQLVEAALASLARPGPRDARAQGERANLAYATLLATIDLVKSHTDVPRVPGKRT